MWLISHLFPLPDLWLITGVYHTHPHCSLEQLHERSWAFLPLQLGFVMGLGQSTIFESWILFISDDWLSHIFTGLCKDCQQIRKAWLSPTVATFLSLHHLSYTHGIHPCLLILICGIILDTLPGMRASILVCSSWVHSWIISSYS